MNQSIHQGNLFTKAMSAKVDVCAASQQNRIVAFKFDAHAVRTVVDDNGEIWFVGKDVAAVLGYSDTVNALKQHCRGVVKRHPILDTLGRQQEVRIISEPDLFRLVMNSKLPAAERFERWVFEEVLPSIRKTGSYAMADPMQILNDPAAMRGLLLTYTEKVLALKSRVVELESKAEALDRIADADGLVNPTVAAKALQVPPRRLFDYLREHRWIYRRPGGNNVAYQDKIHAGYLTHKVTTILRDDGTERMVEQVLVTGKGLAKLSQVFGLH